MMSSHFDGLLNRTLGLARDLFGDAVSGAVERAKRAAVKNAMPLIVGAAAVVLALVFGAIGFERWMETVVDANHRWAAPVIVAVVCGVIGFGALRSGRRDL
jgi:hypothetical protein